MSECHTPACTNTGGKGHLRIWCRRCASRLAECRDWLEATQPSSSEYRIYGTRYMLDDGQQDDA